MKKCNAAFKNDIYLQMMEVFQLNGFTRFRKDNVDWPFSPDFHCWVGLNTALYSRVVEINPNIGVHAPTLEKMWRKLDERKYSRSTATYPIILGDIKAIANEMAFAFTPDQSDGFVRSEIDRLVQLYVQFGLPYALSIASYDALLPLLEKRIRRLGAYPERYICCLYLMGRRDDAYDFCLSFLEKGEQSFEVFGRNFLKLVKDELS